MVDLFGTNPSENDLKGIVYDRSCDLHPFLNCLARENNPVAEIYYNMEFIVDIFHCEKHTQSKCVLTHPDCQYHPHLPKFAHVRNMNTEVAEQSFNRVNPFKYITRKMSHCRRLLFLKLLDENFNNRASKKIDTKKI